MDTQSIENKEAEKSNNSFELRSNIQLTPSGSGEYAGTIDIDEEGIYSYKAIVRKNGLNCIEAQRNLLFNNQMMNL